MRQKRAGNKIYHLEYKHKVGSEKHRYYTTLTRLFILNPDIQIGISTLQHYGITPSNPYENNVVIIRVGEVVLRKTEPQQKKVRSK